MSLALVDDLAVPGEAQALEGSQDVVGGARNTTGPVEVLDAHEPAAFRRTRIEKAGDGGDERTEVQRPRRRWGEPTDVHEGAESTLPIFCGRNDAWRP